MMRLADWQTRLKHHFGELSDSRKDSREATAVFAFEHGLTLEERQELSKAIRAHIETAAPSKDHSLAWIVYATEFGYRYSGDEYWQTFEFETPGWTVRGDREWIRDRFRWFQKEFNGAKPSGPWAARFSIICWPITHAILPCNLQRQLAKVLYEVRHLFRTEILESPAKLGEFIAAQSWRGSSRFEELAEEVLLVGQIAAALLLQGESGTTTLIHPATLLRIGQDLDRERRTRDWLNGARHVAKARTQVRGAIAERSESKRGPERSVEKARAEIAALGIEPHLLLRPRNPAATEWDVALEIPNLTEVLVRFPATRDALTESRCVVTGALGPPLARRRVLYESQQVTLARWPRPEEVLLRFEKMDSQLEFLLRTECLLRPGPTKVFRIASDGLAYEVKSNRVRPGQRYILVSTAGPLAPSSHAAGLALTCEGVSGVLLTLPGALSDDWSASLQAWGLSQAKTIEIWPAGLAPITWDGEGYGEWAASETPCLGVQTDHPLDALSFSVESSDEGPLEVAPVAAGEPVFVELPELAVGRHIVKLRVRGGPTDEDGLPGALNVVMRIRESRGSFSDIGARGPLLVQIEPPGATLEQFWEGRVEISVSGARGYDLRCCASLLTPKAPLAAVRKQFPPMPLPVDAEAWQTHLERYFRRARDVQEAYDEATACELELSADELGVFSARFERAFTPLRWCMRRRQQSLVVHLLDDSGSKVRPNVTRTSFETPTVVERLPLLSEYEVPATGGLYLATTGDAAAAILAPPTNLGHGLELLRCIPKIPRLERSAASVLTTIDLARRWSSAKLPGDPLSAIRQVEVLRALSHELFRLLGGDKWAGVEKFAANDRTNGLTGLKRAVSTRAESVELAQALFTERAVLAEAPLVKRISRLTELAERHRSSATVLLVRKLARLRATSVRGRAAATNLAWFCELALRLASDPAGVEAWAGRHLKFGLAELPPTIARAARFLVIATDQELQSRLTANELYAGWTWK